MASLGGNKYRDYLSDEELKNTKWRNGPPSYDVVDKLFEQERTHVCSLYNFYHHSIVI